MNTKTQSHLRSNKVLSVKVRRKNGEKNALYFLFTVKQIEEVLPDITVRPVPFAPSFLSGLCNWRGQMIPVIDLEERLGLSDTDKPDNRFLVVRTGTSTKSTNGKILRCVLRVSDTIHTMGIPTSCTAISANRVGVESSLLRGAYQKEQDSYIIPDLAYILQNQQRTSCANLSD